MTTVINTPPNTPNTHTTERTDGSGWAVAVIILLVVVGVGVFYWLNYRNVPATNTPTNINVTLPSTNEVLPGTTDSE